MRLICTYLLAVTLRRARPLRLWTTDDGLFGSLCLRRPRGVSRDEAIQVRGGCIYVVDINSRFDELQRSTSAVWRCFGAGRLDAGLALLRPSNPALNCARMNVLYDQRCPVAIVDGTPRLKRRGAPHKTRPPLPDPSSRYQVAERCEQPAG